MECLGFERLASFVLCTRHPKAKTQCGDNDRVVAAGQTQDLFFEGVPVAEKSEVIVGPRKVGDIKGRPLNGFW